MSSASSASPIVRASAERVIRSSSITTAWNQGRSTGTPLPLLILSGPYGMPHAGLIAAELRHLDGSETWTWDGRGTPFPSRPMDFVLYSPHTLALRQGYILDTADLPRSELENLGLQPESASRLSAHRPLVTEFVWH